MVYSIYTIYTKHLVRDGIVILTGKKGSGRNRGIISWIKKKISQSCFSPFEKQKQHMLVKAIDNIC